jgi:hypothetical protein
MGSRPPARAVFRLVAGSSEVSTGRLAKPARN